MCPARPAANGAANGADRDRPRDPRVQRSRRAVLAAALELMVERGVFATTIDAVSERSGVAKTTIYRQWPNRDALLADAWVAIPPPELPVTTGDLDADLLAVATAINHRLSNPPMSVLLPDLLAATERDPALVGLHDRLVRARRRPLLELVTAAVAEGRLPSLTDAEMLVSLILGPLLYRRVVVQQAVPAGLVEQVVATALAAARAGLVPARTAPTAD